LLSESRCPLSVCDVAVQEKHESSKLLECSPAVESIETLFVSYTRMHHTADHRSPCCGPAARFVKLASLPRNAILLHHCLQWVLQTPARRRWRRACLMLQARMSKERRRVAHTSVVPLLQDKKADACHGEETSYIKIVSLSETCREGAVDIVNRCRTFSHFPRTAGSIRQSTGHSANVTKTIGPE
jgi:hypothetical protein